MTKSQEQHLQFIKNEFSKLYDSKYRAGQKEHGGSLWKKKHIIDFAIEEAIDQVGYLLTLREQIKDLDVGEIEE